MIRLIIGLTLALVVTPAYGLQTSAEERLRAEAAIRAAGFPCKVLKPESIVIVSLDPIQIVGMCEENHYLGVRKPDGTYTIRPLRR